MDYPNPQPDLDRLLREVCEVFREADYDVRLLQLFAWVEVSYPGHRVLCNMTYLNDDLEAM